MRKLLCGVTLGLCSYAAAQNSVTVTFDKQIKLAAGITQFTDKNCNNLISMLYKNFSTLPLANASCYTNSGKVGSFIGSLETSLQKAGYQKSSDAVVDSGYLKQVWSNNVRTVAALYSLNSSTVVLGSAIGSNKPANVADTPETTNRLSNNAMAKMIPAGMVYVTARDLVSFTRNNGKVEVNAVLENSRNTPDAAKGDYTIYINNRMAHITVGSRDALTEVYTPTTGDLAGRPQAQSLLLAGPVVIIGNRLMVPSDLVKFFGCAFTPTAVGGQITCTDTNIYDEPFTVSVPVQRF